MVESARPKPRDYWLNKTNMAASIGISIQAFDRWGLKPVERIGREAFYDVRTVLEYERAKAEMRSAMGDLPDLPEDRADLEGVTLELARIRNLEMDSDLKEIRKRQLQRELGPFSLIEELLARLGSQISSILESIPGKVKRRVPKLTASEVEIIRGEVIKAQNMASRITMELNEYCINPGTDSGNPKGDPQGPQDT